MSNGVIKAGPGIPEALRPLTERESYSPGSILLDYLARPVARGVGQAANVAGEAMGLGAPFPDAGVPASLARPAPQPAQPAQIDTEMVDLSGVSPPRS